MSAKNWRVCPRCKARADAARVKAAAEAHEAYGKVQAEHFLKLLREAEATPSPKETLREDYGIGITEAGEFIISYHASCQECGFLHRHSHRQTIALEVTRS